MRVDLFELIDGLFKGVVYFFYNVLETIYTVLRRPFRGPMRLYQTHANPRLRQIGAITFLFLSFLFLYAFHLNTIQGMYQYDGEPSFERFLAGVDMALRTTPTFSLETDSLWPVVAATLASTIIFDSLLRLTLRAGLPGSRARRQFVLAAVEYAAFPAILLVTVFTRFPAFAMPFHYMSYGGRYPWDDWPWLFLPPIVVFLVPAAALLASGLRLRRRLGRGGSGRAMAAASVVVATAVVTSFLVVAGRAGARLGYALAEDRSEAVQQSKAVATLMYLECKVSGPALSVEAVIWNRLDTPLVQSTDGYSLDIQGNPPPHPHVDLVGDDLPSLFVLAPGEARALRFVARDYVAIESDRGKSCELYVGGQMYEASRSSPYLIE